MKTGITTFYALFGDGQRIEIPVIQRDYAQGRDDEHSQEVRKRFVGALNEALSAGRTDAGPLDLDFVYGKWVANKSTLEPLDGQQRLTTLFLLHWYLACLDEAFDAFRSWMVLPTGGSCFTYRTRTAAREFFDALVSQAAPLRLLSAQSNALSEWITDSGWFVRSWRRDPTVRGCLTMLDAIHTGFGSSNGAWPRLVSTTSPAIIFRLLRLKDFDLSDDLYVKMNARGKALTLFEVFKAELEQFINEVFGDEKCPRAPEVSWLQYVSRQFDVAWTDFLWRHRENGAEIDSQFMHLIRAIAVVRCVDRSNDNDLPKQIERILTTPEPGVPLYEELGCLDKHIVERFVGVLDMLAAHPQAPVFIGRTEYLDEAVLFRRILLARNANQVDGLTLIDWVMFYAWCSFALLFAKDVGTAAMRASFHDWIRVLANLTRNSNIDRTDRLIGALRGVRHILQSSGTEFLSRVANGALDETRGFNQQQQREERIKAELILRNFAWRPLIESAEAHPYFRGDIEFLLRFCGVFARRVQIGSCAWTDDEDTELRQSLTDWYDRTCAVFPIDATSWPTRFPDFLWERALLATGDYLLPHGRNLSFLDDKDRDASWKRLLRADTQVPDQEARRDVVRNVLARIDLNDVVGSLRSIVAKGPQGDDTKPLSGLRRRLVAEPRLIGYCERRMLRIEEDTAFLLVRAQRNGYHADLYVYDLFLRLEARRGELAPFEVSSTGVFVRGAYPPSQIQLSAAPLGVSLLIQKQLEMIQLQLQFQIPNALLMSHLADWTAVGGVHFSRAVFPDAAETAIVELAELLRSEPFEPLSPSAIF